MSEMSAEEMKLITSVAASVISTLLATLLAFVIARRHAARIEDGKFSAMAKRFDEFLNQQKQSEEMKLAVASKARANQEHNLVSRQKIEELAYQAVAFGDALQSSNPYKVDGIDPARPILFRMQATVSLYFPDLQAHVDEFYAVHFAYRDRQLMEPSPADFDSTEILNNIKRLTNSISSFTLALRNSLTTMLATMQTTADLPIESKA